MELPEASPPLCLVNSQSGSVAQVEAFSTSMIARLAHRFEEEGQLSLSRQLLQNIDLFTSTPGSVERLLGIPACLGELETQELVINTSGIPVKQPMLIAELRAIAAPTVDQSVLTDTLVEEHDRRAEYARYGYVLTTMGVVVADVSATIRQPHLPCEQRGYWRNNQVGIQLTLKKFLLYLEAIRELRCHPAQYQLFEAGLASILPNELKVERVPAADLRALLADVLVQSNRRVTLAAQPPTIIPDVAPSASGGTAPPLHKSAPAPPPSGWALLNQARAKAEAMIRLHADMKRAATAEVAPSSSTGPAFPPGPPAFLPFSPPSPLTPSVFSYAPSSAPGTPMEAGMPLTPPPLPPPSWAPGTPMEASLPIPPPPLPPPSTPHPDTLRELAGEVPMEVETPMTPVEAFGAPGTPMDVSSEVPMEPMVGGIGSPGSASPLTPPAETSMVVPNPPMDNSDVGDSGSEMD